MATMTIGASVRCLMFILSRALASQRCYHPIHIAATNVTEPNATRRDANAGHPIAGSERILILGCDLVVESVYKKVKGTGS